MNNNPPEVLNVSGSVRTVGDTVRPAQHRDTSGRYRTRTATLIRGLDAPGTERTELLRDSVTGQMIRGRNNAVKFRDDGPVHYWSPDHSQGADPVRRSHEGAAGAHDLLNDMLTNPCHTTGGAVCNG